MALVSGRRCSASCGASCAANALGWTSPEIVGSLVAGVVLLAAFVAWELRSPAPMLPMRLFRNRAFSAANGASLLMFFGMFGSIFLLSQYLQTCRATRRCEAGVRTLPWTAMPMIVAPIAGVLVTDRIGGRPLLVAGPRAAGDRARLDGVHHLADRRRTSSWSSRSCSPASAWALFFAPIATVVLSSVRLIEAGQASGANNAIRELGGVFGVAVLASIFAHQGGYGSPQLFTDGLVAAVSVGAVVVGVGAGIALPDPARRRAMAPAEAPAGETAAA